MIKILLYSTLFIISSIAHVESFVHWSRTNTRNALFKTPLNNEKCERKISQKFILTSTKEASTSLIYLSTYSSWENGYSREDLDNSDDVDLSYLPIDVFALPRETEAFLKRVTFNYMMSEVRKDINEVMIDEVLQVIEAEYHYSDIDVEFKDLKISKDIKALNDQRSASKILSFAAMHCLPAEITILLLAQSKTTGTTLQDVIISFKKNGWKTVSFPNGICLRLKRGYMTSKRLKYSPIPIKSFLTRKRDIAYASSCLEKSLVTKPPKRLANTTSMMAVFDEMAPELVNKAPASLSRNIIDMKNILTYFPQKNRMWRKIVISSIRKKIKSLLERTKHNFPIVLAVTFTGLWLLRTVFNIVALVC